MPVPFVENLPNLSVNNAPVQPTLLTVEANDPIIAPEDKMTEKEALKQLARAKGGVLKDNDRPSSTADATTSCLSSNLGYLLPSPRGSRPTRGLRTARQHRVLLVQLVREVDSPRQGSQYGMPVSSDMALRSKSGSTLRLRLYG